MTRLTRTTRMSRERGSSKARMTITTSMALVQRTRATSTAIKITRGATSLLMTMARSLMIGRAVVVKRRRSEERVAEEPRAAPAMRAVSTPAAP